MKTLIKIGVTALTLCALAVPTYATPNGNANGNASEGADNAGDGAGNANDNAGDGAGNAGDGAGNAGR